MKMRERLQETHGPGFELLRHFLLRFFDSDLVTADGQWTNALIGGFSVLAPWFPIFTMPLRFKYGHFSSLATPGPYRQAVRGDELWLITLMMSAIGLVTAIKWQSLFPGLRDYQALGSLPLKPRQIFVSKLLALLLVITALTITLNALPGLMFPLVSSGRWQINPSLPAHILVHGATCAAACFFFFFGLVALQGVLLNLLRPRAFGEVSGYIQGLLVAGMLASVVLSFSISAQTAAAVSRPELARWLPPVWFLGLYQAMLGDPDPAMQALARRALAALGTVVALAMASYLASYHRHRELLVEGAAGPSKDRRWSGAVLDWLIPQPHRQAVVVFMVKTLARSSRHRMILMAYGGFALAIVLTGVLALGGSVPPAWRTAAAFVYTHLIVTTFLLLGFRHLFAMPVELKANWLFQFTEREGRREWLAAVERLVLYSGGVLLLILPFPLEARLLGARAVAEVAMAAMVGLLCYEWTFAEWQKLPFTCSQLPGKMPGWLLALCLLGFLAALPMVNGLLLISLYSPVGYAIIFGILAFVWWRMRAARQDGWGELRLKYEEAPDPAIHGLHLLR